MAAPSSPPPSCEILDLAVAATLDDATSQLFFRKGGGGGGGSGDLSWPTAALIESTLTNKEPLVSRCHRYGVPRELEPVCAGTLGCAACDTPAVGRGSNALCVYSDALEAGLRFPMPVFYQKLLRHYGLAPSQLAPNAWRYMAAFVQRCKDAGVEEPLVSVFTYFFSLYAHKHKDKPLGWYHFQRCAGRPRLFSGSVPTRHCWRTRYFFLQAPKGMPWRCPVAWGKPRREAVGIVEVTDAAVEKLKKMPCIDLKYLLGLHDPPVGALSLLQMHSTNPPTAKPESAAASAQALALTSLHQLHATLEAGAREASAADAAGVGDDWTPRKRRCPGPGPGAASVTMTPPMPQSFAISAVPPPQAQGMGTTPCETSFDGAWGSSETSLPPGIWPSDTLCMYDAMVAIDAEKARLQDKLQATEAKAAQEIAHLQGQLQQAAHREQQVNAANAKFMDYLVAARAENAQLKDKYASEIAENAQLKDKYASEIAKLNQEHASEVAKLQEEHHKASTAHAEKVKAEQTAEIAKLQEEHAAEVAKLNQAHDAAVTWFMEEHEVEVDRVRQAAEEATVDVVQALKKDIVLALFPDLDTSLL